MSGLTDGGGRVRARLADVAEAARTSKPIASRILNGDPTLSVSDELRSRVVSVARELGYRPHAAARGLRLAQTGALGILVPALDNPVYTQLVRGAFQRAGERAFTVVLAEDFEEQEAGETFARLVLEGRIDGLIVASTHPRHPLLELLSERPVPHVFVNRAHRGSGRNVIADDAVGVELAVGHLAALGHRRLAHVAGPRALDPVERRAAAFVAAAARHGLEHQVVHTEFDEESGAEATRILLASPRRPTAIFTCTARQGLGVLSAAWNAGLSVPGDLSLVAYADVRLLRYVVPPVTAVEAPLFELGAAAVDALLDQIASGNGRDVVVDARPRLVVRSSTARALDD